MALIFTVALIAVAFHTEQNDAHEAAMSHPSIQIEVAADPEPAAPRVPAPPAPPPPEPKPVRTKHIVHREVGTTSIPLMADASETPVSTPAVGAPAAPAEDAASESPAAPSAPSAGTLEAQYGATLRTNIDARTVPPDSVEYRLHRPHGETRVNFTLERDGSILSAGVARTSGSDILDRQAVGIVKAGHYPPFPEAAFRGELRHTFVVTLEFHP